jgi:hypothetical protein
MHLDFDFDLEPPKAHVRIHRIKMPSSMFRSDDHSAIARYYVKQWDEFVTAHHGEVQLRCTVFVDGQPHKHEGFVIHHDSASREHYCEYCYAANKREFESRTARPYDHKKTPMIGYELEVERRVFPRERIDVLFPVPVPRTRNARIQKKWAKRAAGLTTVGYRTETVALQLSKGALFRIRKAVGEREELGNRK